MNRISNLFSDSTSNSKKLSIYLMAGDPDFESSLEYLIVAANAGADILEIGLPFSDPMAEGIIIQKANERALRQNTSLGAVLLLIKKFRTENKNTPVVLMGYANPIEQYGLAKFSAEFAQAGGDGVIIVDYPPLEDIEFSKSLISQGIAPIFLVSPTTPIDEIKKITNIGRGFCYFVSLKGVTGSKAIDIDTITSKLDDFKNEIDLPIMIGFGINNPAMAYQISAISDGVVIGSKLIDLIDSKPRNEAISIIENFVRSIKSSINPDEHC